jgi:Raf kinase inhibitor-like YbhB/YbcL family protein
MRMKTLTLPGILVFFFAFCYSANPQELYRWVDAGGNIHYTTRYERIPEQYRSQVLKGRARKKVKQTPLSAQKSEENQNLSSVKKPKQGKQTTVKEPAQKKQIAVKKVEQKKQIPVEPPEQKKQISATVSAKKVASSDQPVQKFFGKSQFILKSAAFSNKGKIPSRYSRRGGNISPPLAWENPPEGTKSYALMLTEPDAPGGAFNHWVIYNIAGDKAALPEGIPRKISVNGAKQRRNDFNGIGYGGPETTGEVRQYVFRLVALDTDKIGKPQTEILKEHALGEATLTVFYP